MIKAALSAALMLPLLGTTAWASNIKANYKCNDGTKVVATFRNPKQGAGSVALYFPKTGRQMNLPQGLSADGGRYLSGNTTFWIKGNQATLTRGGHDVTCVTRS